MTVYSYVFQLRRDTAANWSAANPVLRAGEPGIDLTNGEMRIGDGTTAWNDLDPIGAGGAGGGAGLSDATPAALGSASAGVASTASRSDHAHAMPTAADVGAQPSDSDLTAIAALSTTTFGRSLLTLADAAAGRTALALGTAATAATGDFDAAGSAAAAQAASQPLDSDLSAIAALSTTTYGRAFLAMADAAATKTALSLAKADVGLGNVDNTADANKPVSTATQTALDAKAPLASPALTGTPTAPTATQGTNTTQVATTAYVQTEKGLLIPKSLGTTKGDVIAFSSSGTPARVGVGPDGQVLTADAASSAGVKWAPVSLNTSAFPFATQTDDYVLLSQQVASGYTATNPSSSAANSSNLILFVPFRLLTARSIKALALYVATANAGASAVLRLGIFNDASGRPGTVLVDGGSTSINASGLKELTFSSTALQPGYYWAAAVTQNLDTAGANPVVAGASSGAQCAPESTPQASNNMFTYYTASGVSGAFADTPTLTLVRSNVPKIPHVWAKMA